MHNLFKQLLRHGIIFSTLVIGMVTIIFIMGQFNTLHPDAYHDGIMSIVYVHAVIIVLLSLYAVLNRYIKFNSFFKRFITWQQSLGVFKSIALLFTLITVINSIMMVTGIDTPKTGPFAYGHLLVRLVIVVIASLAWQYQDSIRLFKQLTKQKHEHNKLYLFKTYKDYIFAHPIEASSFLFTVFTTAFCLIALSIQNIITIRGGERLYTTLIIIYGGLLTLSLIRVYHMKRTVKNTLKTKI